MSRRKKSNRGRSRKSRSQVRIPISRTGQWGSLAKMSEAEIIRRFIQLRKRRSYARLMSSLTAIRVVNKNRNPALSRKIARVQARLREMHARGEV